MSAKTILWPLAAGMLLAAAGCAPAYYAYPCGCVPYDYCPDPPLPYGTYCGCPTPWAAKFQREFAAPPNEDLRRQPRSSATPSTPKEQQPY